MARYLIICILSMYSIAQAQERLEPGQSFANLGRFPKFIQHVFSEAYQKDVVLRVLMLPSFAREEISGIRWSTQGYEAFSITPSSQIWTTYSIWQIETRQGKYLDVRGKEIPPEKNPTLTDLKKHGPSDYRQIKTRVWSMLISARLAERVMRLWEKMLLGARAREDKGIELDGETYEFAMPMRGRGVVSAEVCSPGEGSKTAALVDIGLALSDYAKGHINAQNFAGTLKPLEW